MLRAAIDFNSIEDATERSHLDVADGTAIEAFCSKCHKSSVYVSGATGSKFEYHGTDQSQHGAAGNNELGCMGCHAGTVESHNETYFNGAARGIIHGASFTWPAGSMSEEPTITFLLGGFIDGYKAQGSWSNKDGYWSAACGGGKCNHSGGTKYWTPVAD